MILMGDSKDNKGYTTNEPKTPRRWTMLEKSRGENGYHGDEYLKANVNYSLFSLWAMNELHLVPYMVYIRYTRLHLDICNCNCNPEQANL